MEGRKLTSSCMSAKLSNFKNWGFDEATTISWMFEIVLFNMHCASTCIRMDVSLYKHPEWRITPSNKNIKSCLSTGLKNYAWCEWNIMKYYELSFSSRNLRKHIKFFGGYVRELKKKIPRNRNVPTEMHTVSYSYVSSPNCIIPLKIIYCSNQQMEF